MVSFNGFKRLIVTLCDLGSFDGLRGRRKAPICHGYSWIMKAGRINLEEIPQKKWMALRDQFLQESPIFHPKILFKKTDVPNQTSILGEFFAPHHTYDS